jgi:hypothetical protein
VINGERHVSFSSVSPRMRQRITPQPHPRSILFLLVVVCLNGTLAYAQSTSDNTDTIRGIVINSVTREPIGRALVFSSDNRFATWTNSEGRFEFALAKAEATHDVDRDQLRSVVSNRPSMLMARKPGFITGSNRWENITNDAMRDLTLELIPESLIVGTITLPNGEAPDSIGLQIFRRQVQDGRARWTAAGGTQSNSDGQFRFADLPEGVYKLLSHEMLDRDPLTFDPRQHVDSSHGYPASIRSGNLDLQHEPLVVGAGGGASPIEITMRDDTAQISGTVEGVNAGANRASSPIIGAGGMTFYSQNAGQSVAHIYCVPLPDSPGQFAEIYVSPDGSFASPELAPGTYRLLAFDHPEQELEYRNPEAMRAYDSRGLVVRVAGGQKAHVQLQLLPTSISEREQ